MRIELYEHNQAAYNAAALMLNNTRKAAIIHPTYFKLIRLGKENMPNPFIQKKRCKKFVCDRGTSCKA